MASWEDVARLALALPETAGRPIGHLRTDGWSVGSGSRQRAFAWERPLGKSDLTALGNAAPDGPILCARTADLGAKQLLLQSDPEIYFTIPHFNNFPAVLVRLDRIDVAELEELLTDAWLSVAPKRVAQAYLDATREP